MWYILESPGYKNTKNYDPGCQIQKCPKSNMSQLQILGLGGFFKKSRNTIHVVYFRKALGTRTPKMIIPGVKYKHVETSSLYMGNGDVC